MSLYQQALQNTVDYQFDKYMWHVDEMKSGKYMSHIDAINTYLAFYVDCAPTADGFEKYIIERCKIRENIMQKNSEYTLDHKELIKICENKTEFIRLLSSLGTDMTRQLMHKALTNQFDENGVLTLTSEERIV